MTTAADCRNSAEERLLIHVKVLSGGVRTRYSDLLRRRKSDVGRYDPTTIWLHWTTFGLIVVLWAIGQTADLLPRGSFRAPAWSIYVGLGRVVAPAGTNLLYSVAKATHYVLYNLFGMCSVPEFGTGDAAIRHSINEWHGLAANLMIFVALIHAMAALVHQYVLARPFDRSYDAVTVHHHAHRERRQEELG
jgi:cytochrome b561